MWPPRRQARTERRPWAGQGLDRTAGQVRRPTPHRRISATGCRPSARPSRVLPMPPAPTSVTSRCTATRSARSASGASRPIRSDAGAVRLVGGGGSRLCATGAAIGLGRPRLWVPWRRDVRDEAVAAAGNGLDEIAIRPQRLTQRRNLELKGVFPDRRPWPYASEKFVLGDEFAAGLDQNIQHIECSAADRTGNPSARSSRRCGSK